MLRRSLQSKAKSRPLSLDPGCVVNSKEESHDTANEQSHPGFRGTRASCNHFEADNTSSREPSLLRMQRKRKQAVLYHTSFWQINGDLDCSGWHEADDQRMKPGHWYLKRTNCHQNITPTTGTNMKRPFIGKLSRFPTHTASVIRENDRRKENKILFDSETTNPA